MSEPRWARTLADWVVESAEIWLPILVIFALMLGLEYCR